MPVLGGVSPSTGIYGKRGVASRAEAIAVAIGHGLADGDPPGRKGGHDG